MMRSLAVFGVLLAGLLLAGSACTDQGPAPTATPISSPRPTFTPAGAGSTGCEACHNDKAKLKEVAAAEKEGEEVACEG